MLKATLYFNKIKLFQATKSSKYLICIIGIFLTIILALPLWWRLDQWADLFRATCFISRYVKLFENCRGGYDQVTEQLNHPYPEKMSKWTSQLEDSNEFSSLTSSNRLVSVTDGWVPRYSRLQIYHCYPKYKKSSCENTAVNSSTLTCWGPEKRL